MIPQLGSSPPADWPYAPREGSGALVELAGQQLAGLGSGWTVRLRPGFPLEGLPAPLAGAFGRGGVFRLGEVVLRPYRRGGLVRLVNQSTYGGIGRFEQEFAVHDRLYAAGFPTVRPLGYAHRRRGLGWQGVFLTAWQEGRPWPAEWSTGLLPDLGTAIRILAGVGCWAPDLNATNVLALPGGGMLLLDWDRAAFASPQGLIERYRRRMVRSLQKLDAPADVLEGFLACLEDS